MLISRLQSSLRVQNVVLSNSKEIEFRELGTENERTLIKNLHINPPPPSSLLKRSHQAPTTVGCHLQHLSDSSIRKIKVAVAQFQTQMVLCCFSELFGFVIKSNKKKKDKKHTFKRTRYENIVSSIRLDQANVVCFKCVFMTI